MSGCRNVGRAPSGGPLCGSPKGRNNPKLSESAQLSVKNNLAANHNNPSNPLVNGGLNAAQWEHTNSADPGKECLAHVGGMPKHACHGRERLLAQGRLLSLRGGLYAVHPEGAVEDVGLYPIHVGQPSQIKHASARNHYSRKGGKHLGQHVMGRPAKPLLGWTGGQCLSFRAEDKSPSTHSPLGRNKQKTPTATTA